MDNKFRPRSFHRKISLILLTLIFSLAYHVKAYFSLILSIASSCCVSEFLISLTEFGAYNGSCYDSFLKHSILKYSCHIILGKDFGALSRTSTTTSFLVYNENSRLAKRGGGGCIYLYITRTVKNGLPFSTL